MTAADPVNAPMPQAALELRDIRGPVGIPGEWLWLWILLGIIAALSLGAWIWILCRRRKARARSLDPQKPAWETALEAMAAIEREGLASQGLVKEYYSRLSGVVRWYIEERFNVRAPEMTTEEFMAVAQSSGKLPAAQQGFLQDFLNASDMVKFAKFVPSVEQMLSAMRLARIFVEESR